MTGAIPVSRVWWDLPKRPREKAGGPEARPMADPWRQVCGFCELPDCSRQEGAYKDTHPAMTYPDCLVWVARQRGLTPEETIRRLENVS